MDEAIQDSSMERAEVASKSNRILRRGDKKRRNRALPFIEVIFLFVLALKLIFNIKSQCGYLCLVILKYHFKVLKKSTCNKYFSNVLVLNTFLKKMYMVLVLNDLKVLNTFICTESQP